MSEAKLCKRCGGRVEHAPLEDALCAARTFALIDAQRHAETLDRPPAAVAVADLVAHLNDIYGDGSRAHRAALTVLDLGWRPAVVPAGTETNP